MGDLFWIRIALAIGSLALGLIIGHLKDHP